MKTHPPEPRLKINNIIFKLLEKMFVRIKHKQHLLVILKHALDNGVIDDDELRIIEGGIKISGMPVREIMVPRAKMTFVQENQKIEEFLPKLIKSAHSRFPVINEEGKVIGILMAKDLLRYVNKSNGDFDLAKIIHQTIHIPESKRLDVLLEEFRNKKLHMAIVVDEFGLTTGLVTIEDVLEEIVGEIEDEHDSRKGKSSPIVKIPFSKNMYRVKADTSLEEFNNYFSSDIQLEDVDSIGGMLINKLQRMPAKGDKISIGNMDIKVAKQNKRRIEELTVTVHK
ncbi:MAG: CBS domain-containing protein [Gammaproteobacteria bacterium]|nr:CBS domain-containing protein [Gammaproteobacteria bacterium]